MARLTNSSLQSGTPRGSYLPQLRRQKDNKPPLQLQERDFEIIKAVWDNRFFTLSLFVQLFPPDLTRTPPHVLTEQPKRPGTNLERRLAKLFHHGYLRRVRTERGGELIYALDQRGTAGYASRLSQQDCKRLERHEKPRWTPPPRPPKDDDDFNY